jgi:hypothetical protein
MGVWGCPNNSSSVILSEAKNLFLAKRDPLLPLRVTLHRPVA